MSTAHQMDLPAMLAALEEAGARAREETRQAREAIQDARQARRELDERIRTAKAEVEEFAALEAKRLVDLAIAEQYKLVAGEFGKHAHKLYDKLNQEARLLMSDIIDIIDGTGDVTPAAAMKARAIIARFQAQEPGHPIAKRARKEGRR